MICEDLCLSLQGLVPVFAKTCVCLCEDKDTYKSAIYQYWRQESLRKIKYEKIRVGLHLLTINLAIVYDLFVTLRRIH